MCENLKKNVETSLVNLLIIIFYERGDMRWAKYCHSAHLKAAPANTEPW